jgi:hypothetical protein
MEYLPDVELQRILSWLSGVVHTDEESAKETAQRAGPYEDSGIASCAESPPTFPPRCPGLLRSFGCANAKKSHIKLISKFYNLTSLVLSSLLRVRTLAPLNSLKMLKNFSLVMTPFSVAQEFLQSIGNQLICIKLNDVSKTDFEFISRNCRSLKCLYLYLTWPKPDTAWQLCISNQDRTSCLFRISLTFIRTVDQDHITFYDVSY